MLDGRTYDEYPERSVSAVPDRLNCLKSAAEFLESFGVGFKEHLVQLRA
jgi:hypothetical protein